MSMMEMQMYYEEESELVNNFWADCYYYSEKHGVSNKEAEKVVLSWDCYASLRPGN